MESLLTVMDYLYDRLLANTAPCAEHKAHPGSNRLSDSVLFVCWFVSAYKPVAKP